MEPRVAARNAIKYVFDAVPDERITVIADESRRYIGEEFAIGALELGLVTRLLTLKDGEEVRRDVPASVVEAVARGTSDLFITIFRESEKETPFRVSIINLISRYRRYRLGHCPGITMDMLTEGALAMTEDEHKSMYSSALSLMSKLSNVRRMRVTSENGTDVEFSVEGRDFFTDTKFDWSRFKWCNLPTGEVIVAPVETSLDGKIVCDLAIGGIGPMNVPFEIKVRGGRAEEFRCDDRSLLKRVESALGVDAMGRYVGEFAFGLNKRARISAGFLEAEKVADTVHFAFGHNTDFPGGKNTSATHMDFLISKPTVECIDSSGRKEMVMSEGRRM
ncbi:MAG: aminopeptidase [Candidatus Verstraetearchaeota archaeon]|nr:aminopeptidase [Candidatus Verstraetearchaeota archaeon]